MAAICFAVASLLPLRLAPDGRTFAIDATPVCIDLRPASHATQPGACSVPLATLERRLFELPPPGEWPLELVGTSEQLAAARELLYPKGWRAREIEIGADASADAAAAAPAAVSPYRPNSFLAAALDALPELDHAALPGLAVDLGCGSGRDAVHLAHVLSQRAPRWSVVGVDNHAAALDRGRLLAERVLPGAKGDDGGSDGSLPTTRCDFVAADLRKRGLETLLDSRPDAPLRLVHGCRWLDVKLLSEIPALLAPGGYFLWSTFLDPPDGSEPLAPPYRRSRRLSSGQMRELLGESAGMRVLYDGEGELLTRGTWIPAQFFCAQRFE